MVTIKELFNTQNTILKGFFERFKYPFEILPEIHEYILKLGNSLDSDYNEIKENVWVHKSVKIEDGVMIIGPAIIMEGATLRHNAYLRENVIISSNCVVGNSSEIKNSILLPGSKAPHFNYVGDSILGFNVNLGAGSILSNLRLDNKNIKISGIDTNLSKIGAFVGDNTQVGCNSVICPGTILLPNSFVYPQEVVKGIVKGNNHDVKVEKL